MKKLNPWDVAAKKVLMRPDTYDTIFDNRPHPLLAKEARPCELERGVNYFVLTLEKMGCKTLWSCEGHPRGFYIVFIGSYEKAVAISGCGWLGVEVTGDHNQFSLRLGQHVKTETDRRRCLRGAALAWEERLPARWMQKEGPTEPYDLPWKSLNKEQQELIRRAHPRMKMFADYIWRFSPANEVMGYTKLARLAIRAQRLNRKSKWIKRLQKSVDKTTRTMKGKRK